MSIFSSILDKLGIHKPAAPTAPAAASPMAPSAPSFTPSQGYEPPSSPKPAAASTPYSMPSQNMAPASMPTPQPPAEMPMVDVVAHLDYLAKTGPIKGLNWRVSINDLMALLGLNHTPDDIRALAVELGCPEKEMGDSYSRNVWTHQELMKKIAENGGNIPKELLK